MRVGNQRKVSEIRTRMELEATWSGKWEADEPRASLTVLAGLRSSRRGNARRGGRDYALHRTGAVAAFQACRSPTGACRTVGDLVRFFPIRMGRRSARLVRESSPGAGSQI